jgi:hypothetical protein
MANCPACSSQNALHPVRALETIDVLDNALDPFLLYGQTSTSIFCPQRFCCDRFRFRAPLKLPDEIQRRNFSARSDVRTFLMRACLMSRLSGLKEPVQ